MTVEPAEMLIHELIAEQARAFPDRVAIASADGELTYSELADRVHGLAWSLRQDHGVGRDTVVPVLFERSFEMVIGMLSVMAAGGACVPLDPQHPVARHRFIVEDSGAGLLLTNLDVTPELARIAHVVDLRQADTWPPRTTAPVRESDEESLVYCLYTSGSTGEPKGVLLEQRGVLNVLLWAQEYIGIVAEDRILQKTTYTFDISITELFLPLIAGARLVLLPVGAEQSPATIRETVVAHGVTLVQFVPSGLAAYLAAVGTDPLPGVGRCLCAGEPLRAGLRTTFYAATTGGQLYNLYGPTETSIYVTASAVPRDDSPVTIGGPLANTTLRILDEQGRECAPGTAGELCVTGAGVARGYANRPEQTREKFTEDPFGSGGRMYRTGDLALWLDSGELELLGRNDSQVKIRGYRIELGEVESALSALDGVHNAAVIDAEVNGHRELVGYWVGDDRANVASLREGLRVTLPAYMVPSRFVRLDAFPLTSSGKIQRSALPAPDLDAESGSSFEAPVDAVGQGLCDIFQEVLGWGRVGLNDRFLDLGGDSLKAIQVVLLARQRLKGALEVEALLRNDSVGELTELLTAAPSAAVPAIGPAPSAGRYPLSSGQLAMWLLDQGGAAHAAYAVPAVYELTGALDTGALRGAAELLLSRHEALRTAIDEVDGVPLQRVVAGEPLDWRFETARDAAEADTLVREFVALDFDLAAGRVLRLLLIELSATEHVFVVSAHHIATDGWSLIVVIDEIAAAYRSSTTGQQTDLPALPLQYKDYASWQQSQLSGPAAAESRRYWLGQLGGDLERLELPSDRPRPATSTFRGAMARRTISPETLDALKSLCRDEQVTLYAGVSAVLRVLFHRYTAQRDFVLGTSTLGRPVGELHGQVGYYVNTLALRDEVTPEMRFRDVLRAVRTTLLDSSPHRDYPFDRVVQDAGIATGAHRNPLFDVMVLLDAGWGEPSVAVPGLGIRHLDAPNAHSKMDLTVTVTETGAGLRASVEYSTDLYNADRIERLLEHFETLVTAATRNPDHRVGTLALLPAHERERVLSGFNDTERAYDLETPVHHLFEQQVRRTPDAVATEDDDDTLTFAELNAKANALAWTLRNQHGIGPGDLVALLMDRSTDLMVAILGVLKSGGAYLPMSVKDPAARTTSLLLDSGSRVVLVSGSRAVLVSGAGRAVLDVSSDLPTPREDDPPALAGPGDLAYCIYTSGSTGKPNGVLVEHRGLVNRLRWTTEELALDETDVFLQKTPYVFDVSVWELLLPGMIGARQVMLRPGGESDPAAILEAIERHGVTTVHFVPSMLSQYLAAFDDGLPDVRSVVCSGEELGADLTRRFFAAATGSPTRLYNYYGPTEATVDVSSLLVEAGREPITIGRPAPNNRLYVLGDGDEPAPIGVTGELCIAGVQVGRGYLNRPDRTAQRFVADPFRPGERMYRTGDLARWLPGGEVLCLGRKDGQVKIRGFRIEPGEIEQALGELDGIARAVVVVRREDTGTEFLCAYVEGPTSPAPALLREHLLARLPEYMVPSHYVRTESVPVTSNGKVDRKALAALGGARVATRQYVAPRTPAEEELLGIWTSLLPAGRLGVTDDFFVVGGNSLSALQLSSRISRSFHVPAGVASIFTHRTVEQQARLIAESPALPQAVLPGLLPYPRSARHPLSFAQERMWFLHMLEPGSGAYNIRVLAGLGGPLDTSALRLAVHDLVARHEMLRVTFDNDGGEIFQKPNADLPISFETRDLTAMDALTAQDTVGREVLEISAKPFRLLEESPLRVVLFRVAATEHRLLVVLHHIAGDGWSLRLMLHELSTLYTARLGGTPAPLADLPVQYIDYAEAVRGPGQQEAIDADLRYWLDRLTGCPRLELPGDVPAAEPDRAATGRASVTVPAAGRKLKELAQNTSTTSFEITMSALNLVLSRLGDQQDLTVGFPVASRPGVELEGIVGLFLNTLALRTDLSGEPSFTELLKRVSTGTREAYDHQNAPFELLVERLNPVRHLDRTPVFDVLLNYLGDLREELSIPGVTAEIDEDLFEIEAKFALVFYVRDEGDGLRLELVYRPDLFSAARAQTIVAQLGSVLGQVAAAPDTPIASYSLVLPGTGPAGTDLDRPLAEPVHPPVTQLIARHALAAPDRIAIEQGTDTITYGELVRRGDAIARHLLERGTVPGDVIGVTGPRGIGFVAGLLGVLRSGATVFPVDPALPAGRREHLLAIGKPKMFVRAEDEDVVDDRITAWLPTVRVDAATGLPVTGFPAASAPVVLAQVSSRAPAYLFFTSGTTGAPRGVLGWHGALSHFLTWQSSSFGITTDDRCAQTTSASFDVMLRDTFLALVSGGTMVVPTPADELGGKAVFGWLERERITVLHAAPTVLQSWLLDAPPGSRLPDLRWTFLAGEPLKASLVEAFRLAYPGSGEIVNLYGPTETTMAKFAYRVPRGPLPAVLPVGSPLPECHAIVMRGEIPCGVGETGEIVIRTPFRTLGYLDDRAATDAAFFPNPRRDDERDLLYRTGDLGRFRPDGVLEIVGRRDHQIKISGVRIQPAEVETVLARHAEVSACIVVARKDPRDEVHLIAYIVAPDATPGLDARLRAHLSELLPRAMVPGEFLLIDHIPMTPNGKPDRTALPEPLFATEEPQPSASVPMTGTEHTIRDAWAAVLLRPVTGVTDDFFALGGTSLKLLRLYALLDERFPRTFRVAQLFTYPTIVLQAALVDPAGSRAEDEVFEHDF